MKKSGKQLNCSPRRKPKAVVVVLAVVVLVVPVVVAEPVVVPRLVANPNASGCK